jgi:hypothetical protein
MRLKRGTVSDYRYVELKEIRTPRVSIGCRDLSEEEGID